MLLGYGLGIFLFGGGMGKEFLVYVSFFTWVYTFKQRLKLPDGILS